METDSNVPPRAETADTSTGSETTHDEILALREALERAERALQAKSRFLAEASHEIRGTMTGMIGMLDLVVEGQLDPLQRDLVETARESSLALLSLVSHVLDLARAEGGKLSLDHQCFDPIKVVESAVRSVVPILPREVLLELEVDERIPRIVAGDRGRFTQIVNKLVGNAARFTARGHLHVRLLPMSEDTFSYVLLEVEDTGSGFPAETLQVLRAMAAGRAIGVVGEGTVGLGLALVVNLVHLMGGSFTVESDPGKGTLIAVALPFSEADEDMLAAEQHKSVNGGLRVLVADDSAVNRKLMRHVLTRLGHKVELVEDGEAAVVATLRDGPDLVFVDCQMAGLDGTLAASAIRLLPDPWRSTPIVAMTSSALEEDRRRFLSAGIDDVLLKPVQKADLARTIDRLVAAAEDSAA